MDVKLVGRHSPTPERTGYQLSTYSVTRQHKSIDAQAIFKSRLA